MSRRSVLFLSLCLLAIGQTGCMTAIAAFQPENVGGETIVITTTDADGTPHDRVVSPLDDDGMLYVAANHWPRAWYGAATSRAVLKNPCIAGAAFAAASCDSQKSLSPCGTWIVALGNTI